MEKPSLQGTPSAAEGHAGAGRRIQGVVAIVDDDPHISRALASWLDLYDLRVVHFASSEGLLNALAESAGRLELGMGLLDTVQLPLAGVILDLNLPGMHGIALARHLRGRAPDLAIVLITALHEEERRRYGPLPAGVTCFEKPFDLDALGSELLPFLH